MVSDYPFDSYNFLLVINGLNIQAEFSEVSGLPMDNDDVEYRLGNDLQHRRTLPGMRSVTNIVMKRGFARGNSIYEWRKSVIDADKPYRYSGSITLLDGSGKPVLTWSFTCGWPNKLEAPNRNAIDHGGAIDSLEILVENLELIT